MNEKSDVNSAYRVFFIIGLAFIAIGLSTNRVFLFVGIAFFVIGIAGLGRSRSEPKEDAPSSDQEE
jgi:hypothetical protein